MTFFYSMPLVGMQSRAGTSITQLPTFYAADANSLEIVSSIELSMSSKTPFWNCENRIEDNHGRRIRHMARWKQRLARQAFETTEEGVPGNGLRLKHARAL